MKILLTISMLIMPAAAESIPICDAAHEGALACMANKACACQYVPKDATRPARFTWDCGINRPTCEMPAADLPAGGQSPAPVSAAAAGRSVPAEVIVPVRPPKPHRASKAEPRPEAVAKPVAKPAAKPAPKAAPATPDAAKTPPKKAEAPK